MKMKRILLISALFILLAGCAPASVATVTNTPAITSPTRSGATLTPVAGEVPTIPAFEHIVLIVLENQDYKDVIGSTAMPHLNRLAQQNVLLSEYFAVSHPSLPNYIALMSGDTQNISSDCTDCFVNQPNLADLIEASGRTWKAYEEDMPSPCFIGDANPYMQKHNPLIYFDSIRLNATRCNRSIVPLTALDGDLRTRQLPDFSFIMPNMCNSGHDCTPTTADSWVNEMVTKLQDSPAFGKNSLIIITFDEADKDSTESCCGLGDRAGGHIATVLISPLGKSGFEDGTTYSHYSLLKTILNAWRLPSLGHTQDILTAAIESPWNIQRAASAASTNTPSPLNISPSKTPQAVTQGEIAFPIRAAFFYPWFPQAWEQNGLDPYTHYTPTLGYYGEDDPAILQQHIAAMQYGKIQLGIASWWGAGHYTDNRIPSLLQAGEQAGFHWALYVESEGAGDPSSDSIRTDLEYIRDHYATSPSYLKIDGHFVAFVYADKNDGCSMAQRWQDANTVGAYLVLKAFSGYRTCANQPDSWHQYAPDSSQKQVGKFSFTISPGFWKADETEPRLSRDVQRWNSDIQAMIASQAKFQLITTFNEWGEGSAVESAADWASPSGYGLYLDSLHYDGNPPLTFSFPENLSYSSDHEKDDQ